MRLVTFSFMSRAQGASRHSQPAASARNRRGGGTSDTSFEEVESGKLTNRAFHDRILKENRIPIEMVRAILVGQGLTRDFKTSWKFYGPNAAGR